MSPKTKTKTKTIIIDNQLNIDAVQLRYVRDQLKALKEREEELKEEVKMGMARYFLDNSSLKSITVIQDESAGVGVEIKTQKGSTTKFDKKRLVQRWGVKPEAIEDCTTTTLNEQLRVELVAEEQEGEVA